MPSINSEEIRRLAELANIGLSDDQVNAYAKEIDQIIGFVEKLGNVDTDSVEPTDQVTGLVDVWRDDEVKPGLDHDALKLNAPQWEDGHFKVRRVL